MSDGSFKLAPGSLIQTAYVVPDMRTAIDYWVRDVKVGPWFLVESLVGTDAMYRGQPCPASFKLACAYAGDMQIELIQANDNLPSPFRETIDSRGYGLHHLAVSTNKDDVDATRRAYEKQGYELVFSCQSPIPDTGYVSFMAAKDKPAMLEIIPVNKTLEDMWSQLWRASCNWDGHDPVRVLQLPK